ncbi:MAG: family 43 glycosylhydrolase [Eubacterium sp.]|nr:family 43 glycosylhydrolase [Eubacterium sp.]
MKTKKHLKRIFCLLLAAIMLIPSLVFAQDGDEPILRYDFESAQGAPTLFGNAELVYDEDKGSKVLSLDGTDNTYAALTQGFFDSRNVMTITFDVLARNNSGNYFTFAFGQNNEVYSFFRMRNNEIRNALTRWSYPNEHEVKCTQYNSNIWCNIALVYNGTVMKLYVNGELKDTNSDTGIYISDLGSSLVSYLGKSLYDGDAYFNGCFDNFEVYDKELSAQSISEKAFANNGAFPILRYTFEDNTVLPTLFENAATEYITEKGSKVLSLDGTSGTYAALEQGYFDGRDTMTITFDVKANMNSGNYFTFAFGQDSNKYDYLRLRGSEIRNAITLYSYMNEHDATANVAFGDSWMHIALVYDDYVCKLYVNGELAAQNNNTTIKVSDLGSDIMAYFGKSFYEGDGYFRGYFDNFEVYDTVLSDNVIRKKATDHLPLLIGVSIGEVVSNLDGISGTDSHTAVKTDIDRNTKTITSYVQRRQNIKAVKTNIYPLNSECKVYVDGELFSGGLLDLSYDRSVKIEHQNEAETYTLKAVKIANNPVLPGMYADPDIDVFEGKFWIYPTTDGTPGWGGTQFHAFSSPDMVHWTDEGVILDNKDKSPGLNDKGVQIASSEWSDGNAWAPTIEEKNGKYYFYYCARILDSLTSQYGEGMAIGVAWANSPAGPYTASSVPILYPKMMEDANFGFAGQVIDPAIYTENGKSYILFGNGSAAIADLNDNMVSVNRSSLQLITNLNDFRESVAVFKRGDYYYFHWSCDDTGSENYHINYGIATSLKGEITNYGTLLQKDVNSGILATGHQSVIYLPQSDRCFIAYHRFYTPLSVGGNVGHRRETCIDEITFEDSRGGADLLNPVTPTYEGVGPVDTNGNDISEVITYPTCTEDGLITATGFTLSADEAPEVKAAGHSMQKTVVPNSCTEDGYDDYRCTACGDEYKNNFVPKTGHNLTITEGDTSSEYHLHCSNCSKDKTFDFNDSVGARAGENDYDELLDINDDGIINGRDLAYLKTESE